MSRRVSMLLAALPLAPLMLFTVLLATTAHAQPRPTSSGTGFMVTEDRALTNHHVVDGCQRVTVRNAGGQVANASVIASDPKRDLAILGVPKGVVKPLVFRSNPAIVRGETVVTYGFPLSGVLSSGPTLTTGDVSALAGLRDNPLHLQISAPVQPGNSGGPLLDTRGHVVGVVVSKLNAMRISQMTGGDIPQNVNFAIKGTAALAYLREKGVNPATADSIGAEKRNYEVGEIANVSTLFVQCYGGGTQANAAAPAAAGATPPATAAAAKAPDDPRFRLVNRDQKSIGEVFVVPSGTLNYGPNRLPAALAPGAAATFTPPRDGKCSFDVKVIFTDMRSLERKGVDLCKLTDLPVP